MIKSVIPTTSNGIALVGEAPGADEEILGLPFVGSSGQELTRMLQDAGIDRKQCMLTNVFRERPPNNKIEAFCIKEKTSLWPSLLPSLYVQDKFQAHLDLLQAELLAFKPNIIVALGNTAMWALCKTTAIKKLRGAVAECQLVPGFKVLPTYHPAYVLRDWGSRVIVVADLMKAKNQATFNEIRRPNRVVTVPETQGDLLNILKFIQGNLQDENETMAFDIETRGGQITCFGFSFQPLQSFVIPFWHKDRPNYNYWSTPEEELGAWNLIREVLNSPCKKVAHNGMFDIQYLLRHSCPVRNFTDDTMLLHHSLYSELPKGLDFLGSVHTDEPAWKLMRQRGGEQLKKEE